VKSISKSDIGDKMKEEKVDGTCGAYRWVGWGGRIACRILVRKPEEITTFADRGLGGRYY